MSMAETTQAIDNRSLFTLYTERMDSALRDKVDDILPALRRNHAEAPVIFSLGAGTGKVERAIAMNLPHAEIVAVDYKLPMIEDIRKNAALPDHHHNLSIIDASIDRLPFAPESADGIIASSVVHEVASFRDHGTLGRHTQHFFEQTGKRLKKDGIFVIRDFVQPADPNELLMLRIGDAKEQGDADPKSFIDRFTQEFTGSDMSYIRDQITLRKERNDFGPGSELYVTAADAQEMLIHYSWARRFDDEVKERYAYLPLRKYQHYIQEAFHNAGVESKMIRCYSYLQKGYPDHINGRLDLFTPFSHQPRMIYPFTGVIALQRTA